MVKMESEGVPVPTVVISILVVFVLGLLLGRSMLAEKRCEPCKPAVVKEVVRYRVYPRPTSPSLGPKQAKVTVVEVTDGTCPACRKVAKTLVQLQKAFPKDVRLVFEVYPKSPASRLLAAAVRAAAKQGKFWAFHDALLASKERISEPSLVHVAKAAGLDVERFRKDLKDPTTNRMVAFQQRIFQRLGIGKLPAVFVNGRYLSGDVDLATLKKVVREEIAAADRILARLKKEGRLRPGQEGILVYRELLRDARRSLNPDASTQRPRRRQEDPNAVYRVPVAGKPWRGVKDALVTIVLFSDFQCPFCRKAEDIVDQILEAYAGKVKVVWHNNPLPFHRNAMLAAEAAWEVFKQKGNEAFWKYHDALFANQKRLGGPDARAFLEETARKLGVDMARFRKALDEHVHRPEMNKQRRLAGDLAARGTPTFFVNGKKVRGVRPFPAFKKVIDAALKEAQAAVASGKATPATYYDLILKKGLTRVKYLSGDSPAAKRPKRRVVDPPVVYKMPAAGKPWKGARHALVTIVESSDFQCPFCRRVQPTLVKVLETFKGKVKIVWHNNPLPFHRNAMLAAEAAWEVFKQKGNEAFWKYHDVLFENQRRLAGPDARTFLEEEAQKLGVDMARFRKALDSHVHRKVLSEQRALSLRLGARGTPAFFINGKLLVGARPFHVFEARIQEALREAEAALRKVGDVKKLYDYFMKDAKTEAVYKEQAGGGPGLRRPAIKLIPRVGK